MQQENTYIRCIKCWVKSFNLAPYIFVFYIYKLQYDRRYIILNNTLNIPSKHTYFPLFMDWNLLYFWFSMLDYSHIYTGRLINPCVSLSWLVLQHESTKKCCQELTPISTTDSRGIFYDLRFSFRRRGAFHWNSGFDFKST